MECFEPLLLTIGVFPAPFELDGVVLVSAFPKVVLLSSATRPSATATSAILSPVACLLEFDRVEALGWFFTELTKCVELAVSEKFLKDCGCV